MAHEAHAPHSSHGDSEGIGGVGLAISVLLISGAFKIDADTPSR